MFSADDMEVLWEGSCHRPSLVGYLLIKKGLKVSTGA